MQNSEIVEIFNLVADLLEINGENPFRIRAYRNAARMLINQPEQVSKLLEKGKDLSELPGIGKDLAGKIREIVETGELTLLNDLTKKTPLILTELLRIEGIGPKKVNALYKGLGIKTLDDLKRAIDSNKILDLKGFSSKTAAKIREGMDVKKLETKSSRMRLIDSEFYAEDLLDYLKLAKGVKQLVVAGSFRRRRETVGDLDVLATTKGNSDITDHFLRYRDVARVISHGPKRSTVKLRSGLQVDLRVVSDENYGAALLYFTGSKAHNIVLRSMAMRAGMKINEYGVFRGKKKLASRTEADVYRTLKLPYIEPELRENRGEIEAALKGKLPQLIELKDIIGDLHMHTTASDGTSSIQELVSEAKSRHYSYVAITDHSKNLRIARGLDNSRLLEQLDEIDRLNSEQRDFTILKSMEVDILESGELDLPKELLKRLDLTVCAIHSHFKLSNKKQTDRILRALNNPYFTIFAHPLGRLIDKREPCDFDIHKILQAAKELNRVIEINGQPQRMDLPSEYCKYAKEIGLKFVISSDAHSISQLGFMKNGVFQARRGWIEKGDVLNAKNAVQLRQYFVS